MLFHEEANEYIRNCLADSEQGKTAIAMYYKDVDVKISGFVGPVIAVIEEAIVLGDTMTLKKEAIQLGYLCCVQLKDTQRQEIFLHRLSEIWLPVPTLEQITKEVWVLAMYVRKLYLSI